VIDVEGAIPRDISDSGSVDGAFCVTTIADPLIYGSGNTDDT
jgi:hypothetical protein